MDMSPRNRPILMHLRLALALCLLAALAGCEANPVGPRARDFPDDTPPHPQPAVVAFVDVNVLPMTSEAVLERQTVLVEGEEIVAIGPTSQIEIPGGAFVVQGRGRYLVPGLADMHVHATSGTLANLRNDYFLFLAQGITTVRVMWGGPGVLAERDRIAGGESFGPTLLVASPGIDALGGVWTPDTPGVGTAAEARERVRDHVAAGYDFIKVYNDLTPEMYEAIIDEADAASVPVVGHVPSRVGIERVQDAGQRSLEHLIGVRLRAADRFTGGNLDLAEVDRLAARSAAAGVWHTPTVTVDAMSESRVRAIRSGAELAYVSPGMRDFFTNGFFHGFPDGSAAIERENHRTVIRAIAAAGGDLLIGTDTGFGWILPGFSFHDELDDFLGAGLSEYRVLQAATTSAARAAGQEGRFGQITVGARSDLVLLADNPLADFSALREVSGVLVRGVWLSRDQIAVRLEEIRRRNAAGPAEQSPSPSLLGGHAPH